MQLPEFTFMNIGNIKTFMDVAGFEAPSDSLALIRTCNIYVPTYGMIVAKKLTEMDTDEEFNIKTG